jgi:cold shock CspA family protein
MAIRSFELERRGDIGEGDGEILQHQQGIWLHCSEGGNDVFIHVSALQKIGLEALDQGQQIEYETEINNRSVKLEASNIRVLTAPRLAFRVRPHHC